MQEDLVKLKGVQDPLPFIKSRWLLVYCFITAFAVLAICSKSSFLYPMNDWVDANCYFTVGKGMMQGQVVYRDLFEQKGVLLYFLHGLCWLVSNTTFIGVYFLEVIAGTAYLYYAAKIAGLFFDKKYAYILIPILAALVYSSTFFAHGDSAEELCLPLMAAGLYFLLRHFKCRDDLGPKILMLCGVLAGCVLWIKFTMLGFWLAWMIAIFFSFIFQKKFRQAFLYCLYFLAGMVISTVPWFVYFAANGALYDWLHTYFYLNVIAYAKMNSFAGMVKNVWGIVYAYVLEAKPLLISIVFTLVGFIGTRKMIRGVWAKVSLVLLPVLLGFGIYCGGRSYVYYFLILYGLLMLPGLIAVMRFAVWLIQKIRSAINPKRKISAGISRAVFAVCTVIVLTLSCAYAYRYYQYRDFMDVEKTELAQYRFAEIMSADENPTLLNYGFLDGGFYTVAGILPTTKYFCKLNMAVAEIKETQNEIIKNKEVQFVVLRYGGKTTDYGKDVPYLLDNYGFIEAVEQVFEHHTFKYCLFEVKPG
ncbi:MAG: hypothetical protein PHO15_03795 [Eubacteriales bacterium]|nr:hypothetical protein [Eubacteriales bacterium]